MVYPGLNELWLRAKYDALLSNAWKNPEQFFQ
jgi:hypothetical protein